MSGAGSVICFMRIPATVGAENGSSPVSIWKLTTPRLYTSERPSISRGLLSLWSGTEEAANIAAGLDDYVNGEEYEPGVLGPIARRLGIDGARCAVVEDAVSGVRAGAGGGFAVVVGVDRGVGADTLREAGADLVVTDLAEILPGEAEAS